MTPKRKAEHAKRLERQAQARKARKARGPNKGPRSDVGRMKKVEDNYEELDGGRLIVRQLGVGWYLGIRLPSMHTIHARQRNHIIQVHDNLERVERLHAAGFKQMCWGGDRKLIPELKQKRQECWDMAFDYLTKKIA